MLVIFHILAIGHVMPGTECRSSFADAMLVSFSLSTSPMYRTSAVTKQRGVGKFSVHYMHRHKTLSSAIHGAVNLLG